MRVFLFILQFATVSEDAVLNVWTMPDLSVSSVANKFKVICDKSINVEDHLLTGVQFMQSQGDQSNAQIVVASYDILYLRAIYL